MERYSRLGIWSLKFHKSILSFFISIVLIFSVSCGKKEVKRVSEESLIATEAFGLIEKIKDAYIKGDLSVIERNSTKDGFKAIAAQRTFDSVDLTFSPVWVEIEGDTVNVNISWKGNWKRSGKSIEERGMAVFVLKGRPLKIDNVLRANPFRTPE